MYYFLRFLAWIHIRILFKKLYVSGLEHIPKNRPVLFAANHPNSFIDAALVNLSVLPPPYSLARGDVFQKRWLPLFRVLKMLPVYRMEEGREQLGNNQATFEAVEDILHQNESVLIFSEARCIMEKRLRPLRKGTARIAFAAESAKNFELGLQVIPVSINYTYGNQIRSEAMVHFGKSIAVADFRGDFEQNMAVAFRKFNQQLSEALAENLIIIEQPDTEILVERLLPLLRNELHIYALPWLQHQKARLLAEQKLCKGISNLYLNNPVAYQQLNTQAELYWQQLERLQVSDEAVKMKDKSLWIEGLIAPLAIPAVIGAMFNAPPFLLADALAKRTFKNVIEYENSVRFVGLTLFILFIMSLSY
ncbi:MAG: 1-acyl-sn-glycerol-3-phosphate acyltransferase [Sphingobacteriales bacterium]|nr:1-acyl-sn-glycerol-3-phosphate acyltransferase [Sphingobacteriales bacterium]